MTLKEIEIQLTREQAEELFEIKLEVGTVKEKDREEEIQKIMKPMRALFG